MQSTYTESSGRSSSSRCCTLLAYLHQGCQSILVIVLTVVVVILAFQVHFLQLQVVAEDQKIDDLVQQVQNQHNVQEDLNERVEQEHSLTLYQMAGTFTLLSCLLTAFHMTQHLSNFQEAVVQRKILAILWMSPVYSLSSFFGLVFPSSNGYLSVIKDFYEAYVVYTFLSFLIAVLGRGDRDAAVRVLAKRADHFKPPTRCLSNCYHPDPNSGKEALASAVLMECQILAMQFVLVRPITSILKFVCESLLPSIDDPTNDDPYQYFKSPNFYIAMITNMSVFFAFNGLLKFYHAVQEDLKWCKPFSKFMSIKGIVFLTFWQGLLISIVFNLNFQAVTSPGSSAATASSSPVPPAPSAVFNLTPSPIPAPPTPVAPAPPSASSHVAPTAAPIVRTSSPTSIEGVTIDVLNPATTPEEDGGNKNRRRFLADETNGSSSSSTEEEDRQHATPEQVQNFLICLEMLFFSIAHWCVFPAEEWNPDYRPKQHYVKPGIGLKDFASDISYIVSSRSTARKYRKGNSSVADDDDDSVSSASMIDGGETELTAIDHEML